MNLDQQPLSKDLCEQAAAWVMRLNCGPSEVDLESCHPVAQPKSTAQRAFDQAWPLGSRWASTPRIRGYWRCAVMCSNALVDTRAGGRADAIAAVISLRCSRLLLAILTCQWTRARRNSSSRPRHGEQRSSYWTMASRMSLDAVTR